MKKLGMCFALGLALLLGCGQSTKPPVPTLANTAGTWVGAFTSVPTATDPASHTSSVSLNISQGTASANADNVPTASLTAAMTVVSPDCPAITSGTGTGNVTGHFVQLTFALNDGGSLKLSGSNNDAAGHFSGGTFAMPTGTCAPQSGGSTLDKK